MVLVIDRLQVPPSHARALDWARNNCGFSLILVLDIALPLTAAALPAPATVDEGAGPPVEAGAGSRRGLGHRHATQP